MGLGDWLDEWSFRRRHKDRPERPKFCKVCGYAYWPGYHLPNNPCPGPGQYYPGVGRNWHGLEGAVVPKDVQIPDHLLHVGSFREYSGDPKNYKGYVPHDWSRHYYNPYKTPPTTQNAAGGDEGVGGAMGGGGAGVAGGQGG